MKPGISFRTMFTASSSTVRLRRPKKSIFSRPSSSMVVMVYWVTGCPSLVARGTYSYTGRLVMTTPAAWVEALRGMPSIFRAMSTSWRTRSSPLYRSLSPLDSTRALSRVIFGSKGTCLAMLSTSA